MKRSSPFPLALLFAIASTASLHAQGTPYLHAKGLTINPGGGVHANEIKLNAFENGGTNNSTIGSASTGLSAGKVTFANLKVSLTLDPPTIPWFLTRMAAGTRLDTVEVRVYDGTDKMVYKVEADNAIISTVTTGGGPDSQATMEFVFGAVKWFGRRNPTDATLTLLGGWDIMKNVPLVSIN